MESRGEPLGERPEIDPRNNEQPFEGHRGNGETSNPLLIFKRKLNPHYRIDLKRLMLSIEQAALKGKYQEVQKIFQQVLDDASSPDFPKHSASSLFESYIFLAAMASYLHLDSFTASFLKLCDKLKIQENDHVRQDYVQYKILCGELCRRRGELQQARGEFDLARECLKKCGKDVLTGLWIIFLHYLTILSMEDASEGAKIIFGEVEKIVNRFREKLRRKSKYAYVSFLILAADLSLKYEKGCFEALNQEAIDLMKQMTKEPGNKEYRIVTDGDQFMENFIMIEVIFEELQMRVNWQNSQKVKNHREKLKEIMKRLPEESNLFKKYDQAEEEEKKEEDVDEFVVVSDNEESAGISSSEECSGASGNEGSVLVSDSENDSLEEFIATVDKSLQIKRA